jgi:2-methylisocitrate lyase-like PEP mutase family enzyme
MTMPYAVSRAAALKGLMDDGVVACPGAANALAALLVERAGFPACYVTGAGIANTFLGAPDIGLVTLNELTSHVGAIRDAVDIPLVVDADTGFGNAIGVQRTVRALEQAGADAIQLEDQQFPKRCGHFSGKEVIPASEMAAKIRAAVDARDGALIIARTDAIATEGMEAALERASLYIEAGADVLFVEAPTTAEELLALPRRLPGVPHVVNLVEGGHTPLLPLDRLGDFGIALFANMTMQAAMKGMQEALAALAETGSLEMVAPLLTPWSERQTIVRKPAFDALEERYAAP